MTSRGSNRGAIFLRPSDRLDFLGALAAVVRKHEWLCYAYCLMTNHYHLVIQIPEGGLSQGMKRLNGGFSSLFNYRHGREAHLFRNRFSAELVKHEAHLLQACRYVVLNPVRANICSSAADWRWSSFRACAGHDPSPAFLAEREVLALFGLPADLARERYRAFVADGAPENGARGGVRHRDEVSTGPRRSC